MPPKRKKSSRGRKTCSFPLDRPLSGDEHVPETLSRKCKSPSKPTRASTRQAASRAAACITAAALQESWPRLKSSSPKKTSKEDSSNVTESVGKVVVNGTTESERQVRSEEWPYRCSMCPKSFKYKKCIERHVLSDHSTLTKEASALHTGSHKRKVCDAKRETPDSTNVIHDVNKVNTNSPSLTLPVNEALSDDDDDGVRVAKIKHVKLNPGHEVTKENNPENKVVENPGFLKDSSSLPNGLGLLTLASNDKEEKLRKLSEQLYRIPPLNGMPSTEAVNLASGHVRKSVSNRTCQFCGKVCPKPSDLQRHLMKHTGEQPFQCDLCQRRFKAKPNLLYHLRSAHGKMINLSPALVAKFASTKKYKQDYHYLTRFPEEWTLGMAKNASVENVHNEVAQELTSDALMPVAKKCSEEMPLKAPGALKSDVNESRSIVEKSTRSVIPIVHLASPEPAIDRSDKSKSVLETGIPPPDLKTDRISDEVLKFPSSPAKPTDPNPPLSNSCPQRNFIDGDDDDDNCDAQVYSIASLKDWDGHTPSFVRYKVNPRSEEALVTRMIGMNLSNGEKSFLYKCHWCTKVFLSLNKLQSHLTTHLRRSQKTYVCFICGEIFQLKSQLRLHSSEHVLNVPPNQKNQPSHFKDEEQAAPIISSNPEMGVTKVTAAKLDESKQIETKSSANGHILPIMREITAAKVPHFMPPVELTKIVLPPLSVSVDNNTCISNLPLNQGAFSPLLDLAMPALRVSEDGSRAGYHCHYCDKIFDRVFSLNRHERVHTGIKACYCKDCGRGFSEPRNLRHHIIRFHSDGSQRHLLRRCNVKDGFAMPQRCEAQSLATSENSNSQLKETEVSHCSSPDVSSNDSIHEISASASSSPTLLSPRSATCQETKYGNLNDDRFHLSREQVNVSTAKSCSLNAVMPQPDDLDSNLGGEDGVTVIYPTDVPENTNDLGSAINGNDLSDNGREILSDPKRSLIGSLRKQKAHRNASVSLKEPELVANNLEPVNVECSVTGLSQPLISHTQTCLSLGTSPSTMSAQMVPSLPPTPTEQPAAKPNNDPDSAKVDSHLIPASPDQPQNLKNWNLGSIVSKILSPGSPTYLKESKRDPRKRKRKVNSGHFNYSPRLNVVEKPVQRADVCKPHILPDGRAFFECCYCNKKFGSVSDINRHMDFHEDVRPYKCHFCNYYSRTNSQLKVHMMRHQGIKQYLCEVCHYCGVTQSDLNRHKKTQAHCLRARNVCKLCGLGYFTRQQKVSHMLSYHLGFAIAPEVEKLDESVEKLMLTEASACVDKRCIEKQKPVQTEIKINIEDKRELANKKVTLSESSVNELPTMNSNHRGSSEQNVFSSLPTSAPIDFSLPSVLRTSSVNGQLKMGVACHRESKKVRCSLLSEKISNSRCVTSENREIVGKIHTVAGKAEETFDEQNRGILEVSHKYVKKTAAS